MNKLKRFLCKILVVTMVMSSFIGVTNVFADDQQSLLALTQKMEVSYMTHTKDTLMVMVWVVYQHIS